MLIVCFRIGIADGTGIAVLEGHDGRHRQDQPVLEEALPEAKGILIIHAVVGALQGDFGKSYTFQRDVTSLIGERALNTFWLSFVSVILSSSMAKRCFICVTFSFSVLLISVNI